MYEFEGDNIQITKSRTLFLKNVGIHNNLYIIRTNTINVD